MNKFKEFLTEGNVFPIAIGFMIGTQVAFLTNTLTTSLIDPILIKWFNIKQIKDKKIRIFGADIYTGQLLSAFIQFFVFLLFIFILWLIFKKIQTKI